MQPQLEGVQAQEGPASTEGEDLPAPFPGVAKTESWREWRALPHFGHSMLVLRDMTRRSYCAWQSSQTYS